LERPLEAETKVAIVPTLKAERPRLSNIVGALGRVSRVVFFAFWAVFLSRFLIFAVTSHASLEAPLPALVMIIVLVAAAAVLARWAFARGQKNWTGWALAGAASVVAWVLYWR
jgi:hypothetical protein